MFPNKSIIAPLFLLTFFGGIMSGYTVFVEPYMVTTAEYQIASENLPDAFDGKRIALITDIHHGSRGSYNLLDKVVRMTQELSPDVILFGGDYTNERPELLGECFAKLSDLDAPLGMYAVLGNHDLRKLSQKRRAMEDAGIVLLENKSVWLKAAGERILLIGIKDLWNSEPSLAGMQRDIAKSDFTVLLSHNPDYYDAMSTNDREHIDLMLSGHTHGGQITVFGLYAPKKTAQAKYTTGLVKPDDGRTQIIVSNGIGTVGLPIRFFARPQIVLVTLKKQR